MSRYSQLRKAARQDRHSLGHQLSIARWAFRRRGWHPAHKRLARLRNLYWVLLRWHETETCDVCGGPVDLVFHVPDELWLRVRDTPHGQVCPACFDDLARARGLRTPFWSCELGEFPQCDGSPCAHAETMAVISRQRVVLWRALLVAGGGRDGALRALELSQSLKVGEKVE